MRKSVHNPRVGLSRLLTWLSRLAALLLAALLGAGCGKPPLLTQRYILEYPSPRVAAPAKVATAIKVEQFSVAQAYNSTAMVYRPRPFENESYSYSRWRANPGYLVTDYLLRDLRNSGLFEAAFGPSGAGPSRFLLEGGVERFAELDEPGGWQADLALTVTLLDATKEEIPQKVVFQKNYQAQEPIFEKNPGGLAQAMSRAMERLSAQIITDIYQAIQRRLSQGPKAPAPAPKPPPPTR